MSVFGWSLPPGCTDLPYDNEGAYEEKINGVWYAWDENDRVYRQDPKHSAAREDGYVYIGDIVWPQALGPEFSEISLLRSFVENLEK